MATRRGTVLKTVGGVYVVRVEGGEVVEAALRGRLKLEQRTGDKVVAGDVVQVAIQGDGRGTIEEVEPRRTELARRAPGSGGRRAKVIVANVDRLVAVFAAAEPEPRLRMLDRFLVLAEANGLSSAVVVNKADLAAAEDGDPFSPYARAGYSVLRTSAKQGSGLDALRVLLCGGISVLTGPSGVGKSSLLNAIQPGLSLATASIADRILKGRHTTVAAELIPLDCGGFVADTPGLREVGLWRVAAAELDRCFPEMRPHLGECRFGSCSHLHEPDCAVRRAVTEGEIAAERYESYRRMYEEDEGAGPHR